MIGTHRFQNGSLILVKNKTTAYTWFFRFYEEAEGRRVYRKLKVGSVEKLPHRRDAEKAVLALRSKINFDTRSPDTVNELITHYKKHELTAEAGKRSSTREVYSGFLKVHIATKWGSMRLDQIKTTAVEQWLRSLALAPATKTKIRNIMSGLFAHAKRYDMLSANPMQGVRSSSKRLKEPDILTPMEFKALFNELPQRERAMVLLIGTTGLRRSELIALKWGDVDFDSSQIGVNKSCVRGKIDDTKTLASAKPVPMHPVLADALREWRQATIYKSQTDFLFPSLRKNGTVPVWPDMVLQKVIRPAAVRAGIKDKLVGYHTFRHSLGTNLRSLGVDIKTAQDLLRHANAKITLDLHTQSVSSQRRDANNRLVELLLPEAVAAQNLQHPSAPSGEIEIPLSC
jgi:integrase